VRGFRVYKPVPDGTQTSGYRFQADGIPLWIAAAPPDRNLYTAMPDGTIVPFRPGNAPQLAPLMGLPASEAEAVSAAVRVMPLGAIIDSTPAIMNPPSLDPPPDPAYPAFAKLHDKRRTLLWVGTNRGVLEAIDARTGVEVWGFVPPNLLPKLKSLREGQTIGGFTYFMDASPRISDVLVPGRCDDAHPELCWRTHLVVGQGPGGTFYQSFDVTLDGLDAAVAPDGNDPAALLAFFSNPSRITLNWSFPRYSRFDPTPTATTPFGDLHASATEVEKTVGQTWSAPAIGQLVSGAGPYSVLVGSGFLPFSIQQQRHASTAGTTFYLLNATDGSVHASMDAGNDGLNETSDGCGVVANDCQQIKNALQADPVAAGESDQRFITRAYLGDLDGAVWRFDITLDTAFRPAIATKTKLFPNAPGNSDQPIFSSMATVNVAGLNQYIFFGTGSDLLPSTDVSTVYHLLGINDNGTVPAPKTVDVALAKTASLSVDEKVTAVPAVAGDIVFFTTTRFSSAACTAPSANLYALTFLGGPAYDTNADNLFNGSDSVRVTTIAGERATAPFVVDQHLVLGAGGRVSLFGDPADFNNGVGNAGVRILSWREVR
jgi:Tfp pilus tip-associated adhesin PilY1